MEKDDQKRFAELITGMAQTFHTPISTWDIENYWQFLRTYSLKTIEQAIIHYCGSPEGHRFLPKPGELVATIQGDGVGRALRAWAKVMRTIRSVGAYKTVVFDDALIHAVIWDMGGWPILCEMLIKDEQFRAREFERRYLSYVAHPPGGYPKQLTGITDSVNKRSGYVNVKPPLMIGDEKKALQIFQNGCEANKLLAVTALPMAELNKLEEKSS